MKQTLIRLCLALLALGIVETASAQTSITTTTLTNAITTTAVKQDIVVASTSGMAVGTTFLYIDGSFYRIDAIASATGLTVTNQYFLASHNASVTVYVVPIAAQIGINPVGSCIRGTTGKFPLYAPYTLLFNTQNGNVARCAGNLNARTWVITNPYAVGSPSIAPPQTP